MTARAPLPIKTSILIHNTGGHKRTSIKLEMAFEEKQNPILPQAKRYSRLRNVSGELNWTI